MPINKQHNAFLVAAPSSNSGKTVVTLGLIQALKNRCLKVQPFKCGPDYIDPLHHSLVAGQPSYNLDTWMASRAHVKSVFYDALSRADVAVVEGVMGLFDGANKDEGSAADITRLLAIPVVLVVDAKAMAYSAAPLLYGFANFDKRINVAGVIFNRVSGDSHYSFLKQAAADAGVKSFGYLPRDARLSIESRHLGLHMPNESNTNTVNVAASLLEKYTDVEALLQLTTTCSKPHTPLKCSRKKLKIAVANDAAFCFNYSANIDRLKELGELSFFSPLTDTQLPQADLIWLPGGYPELHLQALSDNKTMHQQLRIHVENGKALIAECGGMMYLGQTLTDKLGATFAMAGVLDCSTTLADMKLHLGYREIHLNKLSYRAHEFHYSAFSHRGKHCSNSHVVSARKKVVDMPILKYKNVWASYAHLYLGEAAQMEAFLKQLGVGGDDE